MKPIEMAGFIAIVIVVILLCDNLPDLFRWIKSFFT